MSNIILLNPQSAPVVQEPKAPVIAPAMQGEYQQAGTFNHQNSRQDNRLSMLDQLHAQGAFYDVVPTGNFYNLPDEQGNSRFFPTGKKTLVNGDNGAPISVMSESYVVVQNKDIFAAMDNQIAQSGLDLEGAYTKVDIANQGAQVAVQYIFPAHSIETTNGDTTSLMITAINSFNGSTGFAIYLGGFRSYCFNTQVFGTTVVGYRKQHCKDLNIDKAARIIGNGIEVFNMEGEAWKRMAQTRITQEQAYIALADYAEVDLKKYPTLSEYMGEYVPAQARTTKLENYMRIFKKYQAEMGDSEFSLFNTLTHISTHGAAKTGNKKQAISTFDSRSKGIVKVAKKHLTAYAA